MTFEFIHGDTMLYLTAETENDKELFRILARRDAQILGSNIWTKDQPKKWFAIAFQDRSSQDRRSEAASEDLLRRYRKS
jgi:hypothetical protein